MSKQTVDKSSSTQDIGRVLPPEVEFATLTSSFSGTAKPGLKINLSSSADGQDASVTVGKSGKWKMPLASVPRLYTVFKIWASDDASGAESEKIQFTFGGSNPKLDDVYISEKAALGHATPGSDIAIYTSSGKLIGLTQAFFGQPFWMIRFTVANRPKAGDTLCVIVKNPNGNTSMPHFTQVHTFAIERVGVDGYSGSGAVPGEMIQLFDHESGALIDAAKASDEGEWAITFANQLDFGQRLKLRIIHNDGSISDGPWTSAASTNKLAPTVNGFTTTEMWGFAIPNSAVVITVYRSDHKTIAASFYPMADGSGRWSTSVSNKYIVPGVMAMVYVSGSLINYAMCSPSSRNQRPPFPPLARPTAALEHDPSFNQFTTWVSSYNLVSIQTETNGLVWQGYPDYTGQVTPPADLGNAGVEPGQVAFFAAATGSAGSTDVSLSPYTGLVNTSNPWPVPDKPTMTTYYPTLFEGTETTPNTMIDVYDYSLASVLNYPEALVTNGLWSTSTVKIMTPAGIGDQVVARATDVSNKNIGATAESDIYTVGNPTSNLMVPIPPEIGGNRLNGIYGDSVVNTFVTVNMYAYNDYQGQSPTYVSTTAAVTADANQYSWQLLVDESLGPEGPGQSSGTTYEAYASFPNTSNHSDSYFSQIGTSALGIPKLTYVGTTWCEGVAPSPGLMVYGWRSSDGKQMVNYEMPKPAPNQSGPTPFKASYVPGEQMPSTDLLNIVVAYGGPIGSMSLFERKPTGYGSPASS